MVFKQYSSSAHLNSAIPHDEYLNPNVLERRGPMWPVGVLAAIEEATRIMASCLVVVLLCFTVGAALHTD